MTPGMKLQDPPELVLHADAPITFRATHSLVAKHHSQPRCLAHLAWDGDGLTLHEGPQCAREQTVNESFRVARSWDGETPAATDLEDILLAWASLTPFKAAELTQLKIGEVAVVFGDSAQALLAAWWLRRMIGQSVVLVARTPALREAALEFDIQFVELQRNAVTQEFRGVSAIVDASETPDVFPLATAILRELGRYVVLNPHPERTDLNLYPDIHKREIRWVNAICSNREKVEIFTRAVDLLSQLPFNRLAFLGDGLPPAQAQAETASSKLHLVDWNGHS